MIDENQDLHRALGQIIQAICSGNTPALTTMEAVAMRRAVHKSPHIAVAVAGRIHPLANLSFDVLPEMITTDAR